MEAESGVWAPLPADVPMPAQAPDNPGAYRYGCQLHVADRWYPSSKTCSACGHVKDRLLLSERTYQCQHCGQQIDRDLNAAVNLARWANHPSSLPECLPGHQAAA